MVLKSLSIIFTTSRRQPHFRWFLQSLRSQFRSGSPRHIIIIDHFADEPLRKEFVADEFGMLFLTRPEVVLTHVEGKPTIWKGKHRITNEDWWSKSSDLNTGIALSQTEWVAFVDDRSVLEYRWLDRVEAAMDGEYAVCGYYEKWANLQVEDGRQVPGGTLLGSDTRTPGNYPFDTLYGGHCALPLEWCLAVNGYPEICDSLGLEDSLFGTTIRNIGYPIRYDSDLRLIEDRTPGQIDGALKRADWGTSPQDASHALVDKLHNSTTSLNPYSLRDLRESVLAGNPFPPPTESHTHWFSGEDIATKFV